MAVIRFLLHLNKLQVQYHLAPGRITAKSVTFDKSSQPKGRVIPVDPFAKIPTADELADQYERLLNLEKDCLVAFRSNDRETKELLRLLFKQQTDVELVRDVYDKARDESLVRHCQASFVSVFGLW